MAYIRSAKKWGIPYGIWIYLSHEEACTVTQDLAVDAITTAINLAGNVWAAAAATAIYFQARYIRDKNENSGGSGVKLLFNFAVGVITSIKRRGSGSSPCSGTTSAGTGSTSSGGTTRAPSRGEMPTRPDRHPK